MGRQRQTVRLSIVEQRIIHQYLQQKTLLRLQINRAQVLLDWEAGCSAIESALRLDITEGRVYGMRRAYLRQGLSTYLATPPQGGAPTKLTPTVEAALNRLVASQRKWSLRQLADYLVAQGYTRSISCVTVGKALKKTQISSLGSAVMR